MKQQVRVLKVTFQKPVHHIYIVIIASRYVNVLVKQSVLDTKHAIYLSHKTIQTVQYCTLLTVHQLYIMVYKNNLSFIV